MQTLSDRQVPSVGALRAEFEVKFEVLQVVVSIYVPKNNASVRTVTVQEARAARMMETRNAGLV